MSTSFETTTPSSITESEIKEQESNESCYLIPFPGRCIVEREKAASASGRIIIPDKHRRAPQIGTVLAVGDEHRNDLLGKRVIFGMMSGVPISIKNKPAYSIFAYEELLAIVASDDKVEFEPDESISL